MLNFPAFLAREEAAEVEEDEPPREKKNKSCVLFLGISSFKLSARRGFTFKQKKDNEISVRRKLRGERRRKKKAKTEFDQRNLRFPCVHHFWRESPTASVCSV